MVDMTCANCGYFKCQCAARALEREAAKEEAKPAPKKKAYRVVRAKNFDDGASND